MSATVLKGSAFFTEENLGAHYYTFSPILSTTTYSEAFANIVLPTSFNNIPIGSTHTYQRRNAYISLGITGTLPEDGSAGVDLGIVNIGGGWMPAYHDCNDGRFSQHFSECIAGSTATNALIVVKPVSTNKVGLYVRFVNAQGITLVTFDQTLNVSARSEWNRYYRFASMVQDMPQTAPDVRTDSTYMIGGQFTNFGLYNTTTSSYSSWGMFVSSPAALVQDAWIMHYPKCQVITTNNSDSFRIDHWA